MTMKTTVLPFRSAEQSVKTETTTVQATIIPFRPVNDEGAAPPHEPDSVVEELYRDYSLCRRWVDEASTLVNTPLHALLINAEDAEQVRTIQVDVIAACEQARELLGEVAALMTDDENAPTYEN